MKKLHQQEAQQRNRAERLVAKHADNISSNTDGLRVVWNLVCHLSSLSGAFLIVLMLIDLRRSVPH